MAHFQALLFILIPFVVIHSSGAQGTCGACESNGAIAIPATDIYRGCYVDSSTRTMNGGYIQSSSMSVEYCITYCRDRGYPSAGLQAGSHCFCGDESSYDDLGSASGCNMVCAGDSTEICGGSWRNSVYATGLQGLGQRPLGVEDDTIPDAQLSSSSVFPHSFDHSAVRGRLNTIGDTSHVGSWVAAVDDTAPWIQAELNEITVVTAVGTQGRNQTGLDQWVTSYEVGCSLDGASFDKIGRLSGHCSSTTFPGNFDRDSLVIHHFSRSYLCRYVRIYPVTYHAYRSMRFEVYGY